jgi:hypothetical protein
MTKEIKDLSTLLSAINVPAAQALIQVLLPFIPALQREGLTFAKEIIDEAILGDWVKVMEKTWPKMTEDERNVASDALLREAQDSVDAAFERNALAKEIALKLAYALLTSLI